MTIAPVILVAVPVDARGHYTVHNLPAGDYRAAFVAELDQGEWFDPDLLGSLLPTGTAVTVSGTEPRTVDLVHR